MGLDSNISLLVASLDLSLVRLLRGAIRTADIAGGKFDPPGASAVAQQSRQAQSSETDIAPRRVIHPTDFYEPRRVIHPTPRLDRCSNACPTTTDCIPTRDPGASVPALLQPPWRTPLTSIPIPLAPVIKVQVIRVDVHNKGSLIDVFL